MISNQQNKVKCWKVQQQKKTNEDIKGISLTELHAFLHLLRLFSYYIFIS